MKEPKIKTTQDKIAEICDNMKSFLIEKNKRYGDSALNPALIFSKIDAENSICVRLDDKINRIQNSIILKENDVVDCIGYLVLLCVSKNWKNFNKFLD